MKRRVDRHERAKAIRDLALRLIHEKGEWKKFGRGPEVKAYEDERFLIFFYVRPPAPREFHSGLLQFGNVAERVRESPQPQLGLSLRRSKDRELSPWRMGGSLSLALAIGTRWPKRKGLERRNWRAS